MEYETKDKIDMTYFRLLSTDIIGRQVYRMRTNLMGNVHYPIYRLLVDNGWYRDMHEELRNVIAK